MRSPRDFLRPLAVGAPDPPREIPVRPSRVIHFFPPHLPNVRARIPALIPQVDILLGNLEDAIAADAKEAAREGLIEVAKANEFGDTQLWVRVNALDSPWFLDDMLRLVAEAGTKLDVIMLPKVEGEQDIHYLDRLLAQLEARHRLQRPLLIHAILETPQGVTNVEQIATASPRMQGISFGPADLAASRRMKTTRVGGGHPSYLVRADPDPEHPEAERRTAQQDPWHYTLARMVDACTMAGILPFYGPFGDIADQLACEDQFRAAFLLGCVGAWSLHPSQIEIARRVFSPAPADVREAKKIMDAMGEGSGVVMLDGKMQDDATYKQAKVMWDSARMMARRDHDLTAAYGMTPADLG
ncbi:MAG: CoA ester lyase [Dehalococcoidia bacterium]|nr:CoA ester lyase [Dehalococcoidia bacterium]